MDAAYAYAKHFVESKALRMTTPYIMRMSQSWVTDAVEARPELVDALRTFAREALGSESEKRVGRALVVLSVLGQAEDEDLMSKLLTHSAPGIARDARTALFELRSAAG